MNWSEYRQNFISSESECCFLGRVEDCQHLEDFNRFHVLVSNHFRCPSFLGGATGNSNQRSHIVFAIDWALSELKNDSHFLLIKKIPEIFLNGNQPGVNFVSQGRRMLKV